jgi:hypothetical protein
VLLRCGIRSDTATSQSQMGLLLDFAGRCDDRIGNRRRMTQHCGVTRTNVYRRCADLLSHCFLCSWIDHRSWLATTNHDGFVCHAAILTLSSREPANHGPCVAATRAPDDWFAFRRAGSKDSACGIRCSAASRRRRSYDHGRIVSLAGPIDARPSRQQKPICCDHFGAN